MTESPPFERLRTFLVSYRHDGASWTLEIQARDEADAKARLDRLQWATLDGELKGEIPARLAPVGKFYVFMRNLLTPPAQRP